MKQRKEVLTLGTDDESSPLQGEDTELKDDRLPGDLTRWHRLIIVAFACLGMFVVFLTRLYPSGFYLYYVQKSGFIEIIGTISISATLVTSPLGPYIHKFLPKTIRNASIFKRYLALSLLNLIFTALMALVHVADDLNSGQYVIFGMIALLRCFQGLVIGIMYVFVQGEIIDLYLKDDQTAMILISSFQQVGVIVSSIVGTELYVSGGWVLVGVGVSAFNLLPLVLLLLLKNIQLKEGFHQKVELCENEDSLRRNSVDSQTISLWQRKAAFYFPDVVLYFNNSVTAFIEYILPVRIVYSSTIPLATAVLLLIGTLGFVSFLSALSLSYISSRGSGFNILNIMMVGNLLFHSGAVVAFGATTSNFRFLDFTLQLLLGLILMGLGEACHFNLCIPSKFAFYNKWNLEKRALGEHSAKIYNIVVNVSSMTGTVISALSLTVQSELPTVTVISSLGVLLLVGLVLCKSVV